MRPRALGALIGAIGLSLWACDPDLPTRACESAEECFTGETCSAGQCVTAGAPSLPDGDPPDQRPLPEFGVVDAGPDAAVDLGVDLGGPDAANDDLGLADRGFDDLGPDMGAPDAEPDGGLDMTPDMAPPDMAPPDMAPDLSPDAAPVDAGDPDHEGLDLPDAAVSA